jgi:hypothetical protein
MGGIMRKGLKLLITSLVLISGITTYAWQGICGREYENFKCTNIGEIVGEKGCYQVYDCGNGTRAEKCHCDFGQMM